MLRRKFPEIYKNIYSHIIAKLQNELSNRLTYHNIDHTLDVLKQVQKIAEREGVDKNENIFLLKVAALYHDVGFIYLYTGHEEKGCELAKKELPVFGLSMKQIEKICAMIMATKIPQSPQNKLGKIICDADLDYLGRNDFELISNNLYKELVDFGFITNHHDWMQKQISFFESHNYFTKSSKQIRQSKKAEKLVKLKSYLIP